MCSPCCFDLAMLEVIYYPLLPTLHGGFDCLYYYPTLPLTPLPNIILIFSQFCSVTQSCPTLCNHMDCSMPGFPDHHQLPELAQTHVHRVDVAIQPSVVPFSSCLSSFPASGSFPMSEFFTSGGQSIGVSASASVFPVNIQD